MLLVAVQSHLGSVEGKMGGSGDWGRDEKGKEKGVVRGRRGRRERMGRRRCIVVRCEGGAKDIFFLENRGIRGEGNGPAQKPK